MAFSGSWYYPLLQLSGTGWGLWFFQEEEFSLGFVKSGAGIGVEAADLSMTTQSLLFLFRMADFTILPKSKVVVSLRESNLL